VDITSSDDGEYADFEEKVRGFVKFDDILMNVPNDATDVDCSCPFVDFCDLSDIVADEVVMLLI